MKLVVKIFNVFAILFFANLTSKAGDDPMVEKSKSYNKTYAVGNDRIILTNSFGELQINTWNNNEIKVEVSITSKATTDARAQQILDKISIIDSKINGEISFKTEMKNDHYDQSVHHSDDDKKGDKHNEENFKVNYVVYMPSSAKLNATNSFGPLKIGDFAGPLTISSKFGSLTAGRLSHSENVTIEFGKGVIERINGGKLTVKFSKAEIKKMSGDLDVKLEFANGVKLNLDNELKSLNLKCNYTTVYLNAPNDLSANFDIKSKFGGFSNNTSFGIKEEKKNDDQYVPRMEKRYSGKAGSGAMEVKIDNEFGHIYLAHNVSFDVNSKDKPDMQTDN